MPICVLRSAVQLQNPSSPTRAIHAAWLAVDYLLILGVIGRIDAGTYYIGFPPSVSANVRPMTATIICLRPGVTFKKNRMASAMFQDVVLTLNHKSHRMTGSMMR